MASGGESFHALIRRFGLLDSDRTPCGQPVAVSHAHALMELLRAPATKQGELARPLGLSKSAVSRMVDQLPEASATSDVPMIIASKDRRDRNTRAATMLLVCCCQQQCNRAGVDFDIRRVLVTNDTRPGKSQQATD